MLHRAKTLFNQITAESSHRDGENSLWMADKKFRESDKQEDFHCEEIDHNEVEIVQVRMALVKLRSSC